MEVNTTNIIVGEGAFRYAWIDRWAEIPQTHSGMENGRTHGVVVTREGRIMVFHQADPAVLVYDEDGQLRNSWGNRFLGAHGMTLTEEQGTEYLWLTDQYSTEVVKTLLDGRTVANLQRPPHPVYQTGGAYSPTWVAVNEERFGGNGDIWVADGYGSSIVHRFDAQGRYRQSIDGTEGGGRFDCPHGIAFHYRSGKPELYIADRGNKRFQVYDAEGKYLRTFGVGVLSCPCVSITWGKHMLIPELSAKLTVLDSADTLVCMIGNNDLTCAIPTWPNHPAELVQQGKFISPHSMAADREGNLYVVEWIIGGRITKLIKQ